jgi:radical SAM superfamily enzyme YgiQ (UPF0313 family)
MTNRLIRSARERLAREQGAVRKEWGGRIPIALVYPNVYAVGMANLGFLAVYGLLNRHEDVVCERVFLPDSEEREERIRSRTRPFSLETNRTLDAFSVIAFSLSYENDFPNVAAILEAAGIPSERRQRSERHPLIMAGGPAVFLNPEPLADLMDFFVIGEAEELIDELLDGIRRWSETGKREEFLRALLCVEGLYVPEFYHPRFHEDGTLAAFEAREGAPPRVRRRWTRDLDRHPVEAAIVTPETEFSGIYLVEVGRGCPHRCRFCSTGLIYRPVRNRSLASLKPSLQAGVERGLRPGLVCACLGEHPEMDALCRYLSDSGTRVSAPSLRLDSLEDNLIDVLRQSGQKTLTLAPETGSESLRRTLNKRFSDQEILDVVERVAAHGTFHLRLYFMVGLPGEQQEDVEAIVELTRRIRHRFRKAAKHTAHMGEITLSVNPFVPKPWSAFQWVPMAGQRTIRDRLKKVRQGLRKDPNVTVTHGLAQWAYLQALFSRGDRRVSRFVLAGGRPDTRWNTLFRSSSLNPDFYVHRQRDREELFPWDFIDHGISKDSLYREYEKRPE